MIKIIRFGGVKLILLLSLSLLMCLAACGGAIDPDPFDRFASSAVELRDSADEVLSHQYDWARERFIQDTVKGDSISGEKVQRLILENVPGVPFAWKAQRPPILFLSAGEFRESVRTLNDALVDYAGLLIELAVSGHIDQDEFTVAASGINSGIQDASKALGLTDKDREIGLFSTAATELFRQYLQSKSKKKLRDALNGNQENIRALSDALSDAMRLASQHFFAEYSSRSLSLALMLAPDNSMSDNQKQDRVVELIELNELLIGRLDVLRRLHDSYESLPGANRDLAASLEKGQHGLTSIYRIRDNAKFLREVYKDLGSEQSNEPNDSDN
ncbi:MAG: hypothetical protein KOO63_12970 [Bacteroidales bacterium]|nr:hypothetical protein [Candidatus Latescibacterota bacterium]